VTSSKVNAGVATYFSGCGTPYCGCGIPQDMVKDDNGREMGYVALNAHWMNDQTTGDYNHGLNCGRIVKISVGNGCTGGHNEADRFKVCIKNGKHGLANYDKQPDKIARLKKVIYAIVVDSCDDNNYWCQRNRHHLDVSMSLLEREFGSIAHWNNRKIAWSFVSEAPPG